MLNKVFLQGRLVADPEIKQPTDAFTVANFRLAVDRDFKNKETGEKETDFVNCTAFNKTAEFISKYFTKGSLAVVEGRLQVRGYEDKEGNKRTAYEVVVAQMYFGGSKNESGNGGGGYAPQSGAKTSAQQMTDITESDGELPF